MSLISRSFWQRIPVSVCIVALFFVFSAIGLVARHADQKEVVKSDHTSKVVS